VDFSKKSGWTLRTPAFRPNRLRHQPRRGTNCISRSWRGRRDSNPPTLKLRRDLAEACGPAEGMRRRTRGLRRDRPAPTKAKRSRPRRIGVGSPASLSSGADRGRVSRNGLQVLARRSAVTCCPRILRRIRTSNPPVQSALAPRTTTRRLGTRRKCASSVGPTSTPYSSSRAVAATTRSLAGINWPRRLS
jgi:hypothetical protein